MREGVLEAPASGPRATIERSIRQTARNVASQRSLSWETRAGEVDSFQTYLMLDAALSTRDLYLISGHESRIALRAKNILAARGPDPGFSGYEYPLAPVEVFLELEHLY